MAKEKDFYGFHIRLATEAEIPEIQAITKISFQKYIKNAGLEDTEALNETYEDILRDLDSKLVFVAFINEVPAGSVRIKVKPDGTAYLSRFGVSPEFQNHGVGKSLMSVVDTVMMEKVSAGWSFTPPQNILIWFVSTMAESSTSTPFPKTVATNVR